MAFYTKDLTLCYYDGKTEMIISEDKGDVIVVVIPKTNDVKIPTILYEASAMAHRNGKPVELYYYDVKYTVGCESLPKFDAKQSEYLAEQMVENISDYRENIVELLTTFFNQNPNSKTEWTTWFGGGKLND